MSNPDPLSAPSPEENPLGSTSEGVDSGAASGAQAPVGEAAHEEQRLAGESSTAESAPVDETTEAPSDAGSADPASADSAAESGAEAASETADAATAGATESSAPTDEAEEGPAPRAASGRSRSKTAEEARAKAMTRFTATLPRAAASRAPWIVEAFEHGLEPVFLGRFRREPTGGLDEGRLFVARDDWRGIRGEEERRAELRELLLSRHALVDDLATRLDQAESVPAMEDLAAPWLPVTAGRATVARGQGLQGLADGIRGAKEATPLSDLAKPFVKEGTEVASNDVALAGARDILAEGICLDVGLRQRLRELFRRESVITTTLRTDRKGDAGRHGGLVGFSAPAHKVPPLRLLAIRRAERERVLSVTCEPAEEKALDRVHHAATAQFGAEHPHAGFLRAAAEDGYRRILKPLLQAETRTDLKRRADSAAMETFERSLRNLLLGPVGGPRKTLGVRPDVTGGHCAAAVDEAGRPVYTGRLPHEATAGREAAVTALKALLAAHEVEVVAVGSGGGRKEAAALAEEAAKGLDRPVEVVEVPDGGTRALEAQAIERPVKTESGTEIPPDCVGALSIARRYQDPLAEYTRLDPKSLGLGPNLHDVHQGRLKERLDDAIASCVGHVGVDAASAPVELISRLPGMDMAKAKAFVEWRTAGGKLSGKAALGAVDGVGLAAAEQAVGFLRVTNAADPRDRTQLHPEQFGLLEEAAAQVGTDVAGLFREPRLRARVDLGRLARSEAPMPLWKYVMWQATTGLADPRPRYATPMKPPPGVTLETLRPGLVLEGRVTRAVPFGVFVDVGMGGEALVPLPHIGDRPGVDPAVVAPVGAVIQARVLEVDLPKRRLTLSMRQDVGMQGRDRPARGPGGPDRRPDRGPRPDSRPRSDAPAGTREPVGAGSPPRAGGGDRPSGGDRGPGGPPRGGGFRSGDRPKTPERSRFGGADKGGAGGGRPARRASDIAPRAGAFSGGGRDRDSGRRFERDDPGAPRRISLPADADVPLEEEAPVDEAALTPEQMLARKLEELKRRIARPE